MNGDRAVWLVCGSLLRSPGRPWSYLQGGMYAMSAGLRGEAPSGGSQGQGCHRHRARALQGADRSGTGHQPLKVQGHTVARRGCQGAASCPSGARPPRAGRPPGWGVQARKCAAG